MYHVSWSTQEGPGQEAAHVLHVSACDSCSSQTGTTKKEGGWGRLGEQLPVRFLFFFTNW